MDLHNLSKNLTFFYARNLWFSRQFTAQKHQKEQLGSIDKSAYDLILEYEKSQIQGKVIAVLSESRETM